MKKCNKKSFNNYLHIFLFYSNKSLFLSQFLPETIFPPTYIYSVYPWQEALHREQMLEQKLATLQRLLANTQEASESSWQVSSTLLTYGAIKALHTQPFQSITVWGTYQIAAPILKKNANEINRNFKSNPASKCSLQALIDEDRLISRLEVMGSQLQAYSKVVNTL